MFVPSKFKSMKTVATEFPQADCTFWLTPFESLSDISLRNFPNTVACVRANRSRTSATQVPVDHARAASSV